MLPNQLNTPVLLLIFNRPQCTFRVFEEIRRARPRQLFVAADGPRPGRNEESACAAARSVISRIDWDCDVKTLFSKENQGCGKGPVAGITWFFDHVEQGIVLEDDCLPAPAFFHFCEGLLDRFRTDTRVMEIGGANLIGSACSSDESSYYFSEHNHTWGWATWRRAWKFYDYKISCIAEPEVQRYLSSIFNSELERDYFLKIFVHTFHHNDDVTWWDYQWEFARRINGGLSIVSRSNLIVNIGLGQHGTHTLDPHGIGSGLRWGNLSFPLAHPGFVMPNRERDARYFERIFTTLPSRMKFHLKRMLYDPLFSEEFLKRNGHQAEKAIT